MRTFYTTLFSLFIFALTILGKRSELVFLYLEDFDDTYQLEDDLFIQNINLIEQEIAHVRSLARPIDLEYFTFTNRSLLTFMGENLEYFAEYPASWILMTQPKDNIIVVLESYLESHLYFKEFDFPAEWIKAGGRKLIVVFQKYGFDRLPESYWFNLSEIGGAEERTICSQITYSNLHQNPFILMSRNCFSAIYKD